MVTLKLIELFKKKKEQVKNGDRKSLAYIRISDENKIEQLPDSDSIIVHKNEDEPFEIEGRVIFVKDYEREFKGIGKIQKTIVYMTDHNIEELKDRILVLDFSYSLFRTLIKELNIKKDNVVKIKYLGIYKKVVKEYPELKEVLFNPSPFMKIFDVEILE